MDARIFRGVGRNFDATTAPSLHIKCDNNTARFTHTDLLQLGVDEQAYDLLEVPAGVRRQVQGLDFVVVGEFDAFVSAVTEFEGAVR